MLLSDTDLKGKYWADDYRKWHAFEDVPPSLDKDFVGRLSSRGWAQEYDAAAELYTRSLFENLDGLRFEFQPELQGKTPDFLLHNLYRESVVADVTVLHGGPMSESAEQQDDYLSLRQKIMDVKTDLFAIEVLSMNGSRAVKGQGGGPVAFKNILRPVRKWIREQEETYRESPSWMRWQSSWDGSRRVMDYFEFEDLGLDLQFAVYLYLKEEETEDQRKFRQLEYDGHIGVGSSFVDNTDDRLREALNDKNSYLKGFGYSQLEKGSLPYIIIIFSSNSFTPDKEDIEKVLYGSSMGYSLESSPLYKDLHQWRQRASQELRSYSDGIFARYKNDLLAVLACKGYVPLPDTCEMSMWINPYASCFSIPQPLFQLKTYTLNRQIVCTPPVQASHAP